MDSSSIPLFKIVLIGNAGVGKTCLVRKFTHGVFPTRNGATIGVDFFIKPLIVNEVQVTLQLWDTAGQERFRAITQSYYRSAHCLVLVYDISSQATFDTLAQWCRDMEQFTSSGHQVLRVLVGNKCDKQREISQETGEQFANANGFDLFMETSALHSDNVEQLFTSIASILVRRKQNGGSKSDTLSSEQISLESRKKLFDCCST